MIGPGWKVAKVLSMELQLLPLLYKVDGIWALIYLFLKPKLVLIKLN